MYMDEAGRVRQRSQGHSLPQTIKPFHHLTDRARLLFFYNSARLLNNRVIKVPEAPTIAAAVRDRRTRTCQGQADRREEGSRRRSTMTIEQLESQAVAVAETTTMRVASDAELRTSAALRLAAFAASLAAAVVVATNRQDRWGITVTFRMFAVWEYVYASIYNILQRTSLAMALWSRPPTDRPAGDLQRENLQGVRGRQLRLRRLLGAHGGLGEAARQQALDAPRRPARGEPAGGVDRRRRGDRVGGHVGKPAQRVVRRVPPLPALL